MGVLMLTCLVASQLFLLIRKEPLSTEGFRCLEAMVDGRDNDQILKADMQPQVPFEPKIR